MTLLVTESFASIIIHWDSNAKLVNLDVIRSVVTRVFLDFPARSEES